VKITQGQKNLQFILISVAEFSCSKFISFLIPDDGTIRVRDVCVNNDGSFFDICGYADVPDPAYPGEFQVKM